MMLCVSAYLLLLGTVFIPRNFPNKTKSSLAKSDFFSTTTPLERKN